MNLFQKITKEIETCEADIRQLEYQIERNQDLYIEGYTDSLKMNNKLIKERAKCYHQLSSLLDKKNELLSKSSKGEIKDLPSSVSPEIEVKTPEITK